ncbi:MAG: hypothetical protein LC660_18935 [Desulfobacteraceae bacterium]|nr:hypothetical protein [Desulfobacteraceae bacterium]
MKSFFPRCCAVQSSGIISLIFPAIILALLSGCASPGPKYLNLAYTSMVPAGERDQSAGLSRFTDKRTDMSKGYVGYRHLLGGKQEIFVVTGQDLSAALTRVTRSFLEHKGFSVTLVPPWPLTARGVAQMPETFTRVVAADINQFECQAEKTGATTHMTLVIDLTFYLGCHGRNSC